MLTLLQTALLQATGSGDLCCKMAYLIDSFPMFLDDPALEAAAAVMMQPFLTQLLQASLTAAEAAAESATSASTTMAPQPPASGDPTSTDAAAASPDTSQAEPEALSSSLRYYTGALHELLGTGV
jgi:hypothetical protein